MEEIDLNEETVNGLFKRGQKESGLRISGRYWFLESGDIYFKLKFNIEFRGIVSENSMKLTWVQSGKKTKVEFQYFHLEF